MTSHLPLADLGVVIVYMVGTLVLGCTFLRGSRTSDEFMTAGRGLPAWAVGLSIFGTYLSSITFLGLPGKAYASNWNALVFSFSLPIAAWLAARYFVPFYRRTGEISAYTHLERRFGPWARTYAVICYLMIQLARSGTILLGTGMALELLTGWRISTTIAVTGVVVTIYTLVGGIKAVVWTDVMQSVVLIAGALIVLFCAFWGMPEGPRQVFTIAAPEGKFSLGSFAPRVDVSTFWVVLFFGISVNLTNFGIDQNYVQRYHTATSDRGAIRSLWLGALLYVPVSVVFFLIGSALFSYYRANDAQRASLLASVSKDVGPAWVEEAAEASAPVKDTDVADRALPHFIVTRLRGGLAGLVIAAILAAAMSTLASSFNSSATVYLEDIHRRYVNPRVDERSAMRVLHRFSFLFGVVSVGVALVLIGRKGMLDTWWNLSGIFAGAMLGLFLLGMTVPKAGSRAALTGAIIGTAVISWMTLSSTSLIPGPLKSPFHPLLIIVVGTIVILAVGFLASRLLRNPAPGAAPTGV